MYFFLLSMGKSERNTRLEILEPNKILHLIFEENQQEHIEKITGINIVEKNR